ncbi:translocation/assembly module TamB domain-containing protein [Sediminibacterium soli]|uniref:translocation/assembly module TamB domain-containing protein n=1 Tax=Sediminibacterium soli TaxID=2698829 RepID=UPI00137A55C1|nr:translocation/assembly module TamB domain-containing protein [Sediminibacterium soli]NCI45891.1 hypothetical protein [Sediminibacterium soli]
MRKPAKWIRNIVIGIVLLIMLFLLLIHTSFVKNLVRGKLESYLTQKTGGHFRIASINYRLPKWIQMNGVTIQNQLGDTVLSGEQIRVDINLLKVLGGRYEINKVDLQRVYVDAIRKPGDTTFNYQFLLDAFTSKSADTAHTPGTLNFSLDEIHVFQSGLRWIDPFNGVAMTTRIGNLHMFIDSLDITRMHFSVNRASMSDVYFDMKATPSQNTERSMNIALPQIGLGDAHIERTRFIYSDANAGIHTDDVVKDLQLSGFQLFSYGSVMLRKARLVNSDILVDRPSFENTKLRVDTLTGAVVNDSLGVFHLGEVEVVNSNLVYNDIRQPRKTGLDPHHIKVKNLIAYANSIDYTGKKMNAGISFLSGREKSGFVLDSLHGNVSITDSVMAVDHLMAKTPYSYVSGSALVYPFSLQPADRSAVKNEIHFVNNILSKKDLALLAPGIARRYSAALSGISTLYLTADAAGNARRMVVSRLVAGTNRKDVSLNASGTIINANAGNNLRFDAKLHQLTVTGSLVAGFLDARTRQQVQLPPVLRASGTVKGGMNDLTTDIRASSAFGQATVRGTVRNYRQPRKLSYNLTLLAKDLETGKWIRRDSLFGKLNGTIMARGSGTTYKTLDIQGGADLASFRIMDHNYTDLHVNISGTRGRYTLRGRTGDPLLQTNFDADIALNGQYPSGKGKLDIIHANPYALGLYKDSLSLAAKTVFAVPSLDPNALDAFIRMDSVAIRQGERVFRMDSLIAKGYRDSGLTHITVNSAPLDAVLKGKYNYLQLASVLQQVTAQYMGQSVSRPLTGYELDLAANIKPDPLYAVLIPGLFFDKNIVMRARIDDHRTDTSHYVDVSAPGINYNGSTLANLRVNARGNGDSLHFTALADTVKAGSVLLYTTAATGGLRNNRFSAALSSADKDGTERFALGVTGSGDTGQYRLQVTDKVKLNYASWQVNNGNTISVGKNGINVSQLAISKGSEQVAINSNGPAPNAPMDVKIDRFALQNITSLFNTDSMLIEGQLNATVKVSDLDKKIPTLDGTLRVDSLHYQSIPIGRIDLTAHTTSEQAVNVTGSLTGYGNNVAMSGTYDQQQVNAQLNLNPITFKTIEPFTAGALKNSGGTVSGPLTISGSIASPQWRGSLRFDSVHTRVAQFGTALLVDGQTIELASPLISFNGFAARDSMNHALVINGTVRQDPGRTAVTNLTVQTKDFIAMSSTAAANRQLYGKAIVDMDTRITGPVTAPEVVGSVALKDGSNITFVKTPIIATAKERENIMQFVDMDTVKTDFVTPVLQRDRTRYGVLSYNLNINISKDAQFNLIIDPLTRDELQVKGAGELSAGVSPNGAISLTGAYNLSRGYYQMNYQFLRRKFDLQEGSTLLFSGDPMNAQADITAVYDIDASPFDLVNNEVTDNSGIDSKLYRQRVPFQVLLHITGQLSAPQLNFDIKIKENTAGLNYTFANTIDNKLAQMRNDPSSMNKQVFGLLLMGRFIGEQSTDFFRNIGGSSGYGADEVVKESVSRFLTEAVNQVASNLIKGVDVNVDLATQQDYATAAERTDLNVAFSKRFLNDRINVTVGKSFTVEGQDPATRGQQSAGQQYIPDITTTYKLSRDGRYMLKAYQRNQYEAILDGYFVETGVAFSLVMDYNRFRELLRKKKNK